MKVLLLGLTMLFLENVIASAGNHYDIPKICYENERKIAIKSISRVYHDFPVDMLERNSSNDIIGYILDNYSYLSGGLPWLLLNHPRLEIKRTAYQIQVRLAQMFLTGLELDASNIKEYLLSASTNHEINYSQDSYHRTVVFFKRLKASPSSYKELTAEGIKKASLLCLPYTSVNCSKALKRALMIGQPNTYLFTTFSVLDLTEDFFVNEKYYRGISLAAYRIMEKIEDVEYGQPLEGDLFTDIHQAFIDSGSSEEDATKLTWNFLGVYGTRGASVLRLQDIANIENAPIIVAYFVISAAMGYLDGVALSSFQSRMYSYPQTFETNCNFARPYHFWMAAYLAHRLREEGHTRRSSMLAPHIMGVAYEFIGNVGGKDPLAAYYSDQFSTYNNTVRLSLISNDLGAWFGSKYDDPNDFPSNKRYDVDKSIKRMFKKSKPIKYKDKEKFDKKIKENVGYRYWLWRRVMAPDTGIFHLF